MDVLVKKCMDCKEDSETEVSLAALNIQNKSSTVLDLVEQLGPHFTDTNTEIRIKACKLLGDVLANINDNYLSCKELSTLIEFLCSRLQDHYTLQPSVLSCLVKVSSSTNLCEEDAKAVIISVFKEVHVQSCLQTERYKVYKILTNIFDSHTTAVLSLGQDFLCSLIQAIDGEQDPRNLLIVFQLVTDLIHNGIDLSNQAEELFEVTSCYFPIDFNPASVGKKTNITNQDLVKGLRRVLAASNAFAKFCIPLLLEKMESDIESAKLDAILTLSDCISKYQKCDLEPFLRAIWSRLKQEIIHSTSQEVEKCALELLTHFVASISQWPVDFAVEGITDLHSLLDEVLNDCIPRLKEPIQDKLTWVSGLMLLACAKGSKYSCEKISETLIPLLLEQANKSRSESATTIKPAVPLPTTMQSVLENLVKIMTVCSSFVFEKNPFCEYKAEVLRLLNDILLSSSSMLVKCTAIAGVAAILRLNILSNEELTEVAQSLVLLLDQELDSKLHHEVLSVSGYLSSKYSEIVKSSMLPVLFKKLPEDSYWTIPIHSVVKTMQTLSALCSHFDVLQDVTTYLLKIIKTCSINEGRQKFLEESLACLQTITKNCSGRHTNVEYLMLNLGLPLIKICIEASLSLSTPEQCCTSCSSFEGFSFDCVSLPIIKSVAIVVRNICQKQRPAKTTDFMVQLLTELYLDGNTESFDITEKKDNFNPFHPKFSLFQSRTVCFLTSSLCAFDKSVTIPRTEEYLTKLLDLCLESSDQPTYVASAKAFAGLLNKHHKSCDDIIDKVCSYCSDVCCNSSNVKNQKINSLTLLIWTTKALVLCNHKKTKDLINLLLGLFGDEDVGEMAAAGLDIIMRESEEVLCPASHAVIRLMYRQRFFLLILPELVSGFQASEENSMEDISESSGIILNCTQRRKANCLTALSHLLLHLPKQVLLQKFPDLMPLMIQSMRSSDHLLLHSVLSAFYFLLQDASELMTSHVDTLLKDFLRLSRFSTDISVRLKALQCVGVSTLLPTHVILPMKNVVIKQLASALDDRKRDVRSEAAKARSEWYLVGV